MLRDWWLQVLSHHYLLVKCVSNAIKESFTKTCHLLYDNARKAIEERRIEQVARRKIQQRLHAKELRQHPKLREEFAAILERWERMIENPHTARFSGVKALMLELSELVARYDPKN